MLRSKIVYITLLFSVLLMGCSRKFSIFLVGDSIMSQKKPAYYPETGWGMPFSKLFSSNVKIINAAVNGRGTIDFRADGHWQPIIDSVKKKDYVFIGFGHNDRNPLNKGAYCKPEEYKANLIKYIEEVRNKKATPVLFTPLAHDFFDSAGHAIRLHGKYPEQVYAIAKDYKVLLIDLHEISLSFFDELGPVMTKRLFLHLDPTEHTNYPKGITDITHLNQIGAKVVADLVVKELHKKTVKRIRRELRYN